MRPAVSGCRAQTYLFLREAVVFFAELERAVGAAPERRELPVDDRPAPEGVTAARSLSKSLSTARLVF
jgi:hypothetical protein